MQMSFRQLDHRLCLGAVVEVAVEEVVVIREYPVQRGGISSRHDGRAAARMRRPAEEPLCVDAAPHAVCGAQGPFSCRPAELL